MAIDIESVDFQLRLIALMMRQDEFLHRASISLKTTWFDGDELQSIAKGILDYYGKYHSAPGVHDLSVWVEQYTARDKKKGKEYKSLIKQIDAAANGGHLSFVRDHYDSFVKYKAYRTAVFASMKAMEEKDFDAVPELFKQAQVEGLSGLGGLKYFEDPLTRLKHKLIRDTISTGIQELDDVFGGGHARQEVTVVMAPPNRGKTLFLVNMGFASVKKGMCVVHLFAEQTQELVAARYDSRLLGKSYKKIVKKAKKSARRIQDFGLTSKGDLHIVNCRNWQVEKIRSYIYQMDRTPDVVIVDYADKLIPSRKYNNYRHEIIRIYDDLITLSQEFNLSLLTASQTNRGGLSKDTITMEDIDEEFGKAKASDNILALCQTPKEKKTNDMRIFTAKVRNEISQETVDCKVYYDKMKITSRAAHVQGGTW